MGGLPNISLAIARVKAKQDGIQILKQHPLSHRWCITRPTAVFKSLVKMPNY